MTGCTIWKTLTSAQGQICICLISNFLNKCLDQYTISDNIYELDTELTLTFILITTSILSSHNPLSIFKIRGSEHQQQGSIAAICNIMFMWPSLVWQLLSQINNFIKSCLLFCCWQTTSLLICIYNYTNEPVNKPLVHLIGTNRRVGAMNLIGGV